MRRQAVASVALLAGCNGLVTAQIDTDVSDTTAPFITHDPVLEAVYQQPVSLEATVTDDSTVQDVTVFYQQETAVDWSSVAMSPAGADLYTGTIPGADVASGGVRYYIEATDGLDNVGCYPTLCEDQPLQLSVIAP